MRALHLSQPKGTSCNRTMCDWQRTFCALSNTTALCNTLSKRYAVRAALIQLIICDSELWGSIAGEYLRYTKGQLHRASAIDTYYQSAMQVKHQMAFNCGIYYSFFLTSYRFSGAEDVCAPSKQSVSFWFHSTLFLQ